MHKGLLDPQPYPLPVPGAQGPPRPSPTPYPCQEDALDREEREGAEAAAALAAEVATRSTVLQRELPRPLVVNRELLAPRGDEVPLTPSSHT